MHRTVNITQLYKYLYDMILYDSLLSTDVTFRSVSILVCSAHVSQSNQYLMENIKSCPDFFLFDKQFHSNIRHNTEVSQSFCVLSTSYRH